MKKKNTIAPGRRNRVVVGLVFAGLVGLVLAAWGVKAACGKLSEVCERQCCVTDSGEQVEVIPGKIVPANLIVNHFNLTNGVNLAHVPFAALRERLLKDMPNIKDVKISRRLPNHVRIEVTERVPVVRVIGSGVNAAARAVDREGVVFWYRLSDTALLPIIREAKRNTSAPGERLTGMARAALMLLEEASAPE